MAARQWIFAGLFAAASLAQAGQMPAAQSINDPAVRGAPGQPVIEGAVFVHGPADTSALGNGGITGGPSAPPPFTNIAHGQPAAAIPPPTSIPEPGSAALLLAGLAGATFAARRRRK